MKFVDPKNDIAFKKIFGDENKKEILISFLNNILNFVGTPKEIVNIFLKNPFQVPQLEKLKESILDIKAVDKRGIHYIIEMQLLHTEAFARRIQYYVAKAYVMQLEKAVDHPKLNQVIFLGFLDFVFFKESSHYAARHLFLEQNSNEHIFKDFELNFVELPKFTKNLDQLKDVKDKWIYFVKHAGDLDVIPAQLEHPSEIREAFGIANQMTWTPEELEIYDYRGMKIQEERGRTIAARKEGIEEGIQQGIQQGIEQRNNEMARMLKAKGQDFNFISEVTGLTTDEIEQL